MSKDTAQAKVWAKELLDAGCTPKDVVAQTGLSASAVYRIKGPSISRPRVTTERKEMLKVEYEGGSSIRELSERFGHSSGDLLRWLRELGAAIRSPGQSLPSHTRDEIKRLWRSGLSTSEIMKETGTSRNAINSTVKEIRGGPGLIVEMQAEESVRRYLSGETVDSIAESLGRGPNTVSQWLKDANVEVLSSMDRRSNEDQRKYAVLGGAARHSQAKVYYRVCELDGCDEEFRLTHSRDRRIYCSIEHSGLGRRDASKKATRECGGCGKEFEYWRSQGERKYCSRKCWATVAPDAKKVVVEGRQMDSSWEALIWSLAQILSVPMDRVDRGAVVEWGKGNYYAPDFQISVGETTIYIEIKGYENSRDGGRWAAWRAQRGPLAVVDQSSLSALRMMDKAAFIAYLQDLAAEQDPAQ